MGQDGGVNMKIAVSGKGGVGKTLVAGVLADYFVKRGFKVLAIDADPTPNLALTLGIPVETANQIVPVSENTELIALKTKTGFSGVYRLSFRVDDIIKDLSVKSPYGMNLLLMGTVRSVGGGCTCPANAVVRELLRHLIVESDEAVIMDMEAGIEHMGRGTAKHMDIMLIVTNPSFKSMETARKIHSLAAESGIKRIFIIGNKVATEEERESIENFASEAEIPLLELIPHDERIMKADLYGESPLKYTDTSEGIGVIKKIGERLVEFKA
jgi:CO dehydrogenase maturation factor